MCNILIFDKLLDTQAN